MLEIWKGATDNNKAFGALSTDLSKTFDCLSHDLLIAKLHSYGLDIDSLNMLQDSPEYLKVLYLLLLFNILMCDMFLILKSTYFTGYADDNTPFVVRDNITYVTKDLEEIGENLLTCFLNNEMKLNTIYEIYF